MEKLFDKLKITDKVFSVINGWGTVVELDNKKTWITVEFERWTDKSKFTVNYNSTGHNMTRDRFPEIYLKLPNFQTL